jgi:hypothetical protein
MAPCGRVQKERLMGVNELYRGPSGRLLPGVRVGLEEAVGRLKSVFERRQVVLGYLFGSYARGQAKDGSDVDIAILLEQEGEELYRNYREVLLGVREALESERFDLMLLNDAPPTLRFRVVSEGRRIYARDENLLNRFEMDAIRTYQDTAYLRAVQDDYLRKRARQWYSARKA